MIGKNFVKRGISCWCYFLLGSDESFCIGEIEEFGWGSGRVIGIVKLNVEGIILLINC